MKKRFIIFAALIFLTTDSEVFGQNCNFFTGIKTSQIGESFSTTDQKGEVCAGATMALVVDSTQTSNLQFQWKKIGNYGGVENVAGGTNASLVLSKTSESGKYFCEISKVNCYSQNTPIYKYIAHEATVVSIRSLRNQYPDGTVPICTSGDKFSLNGNLNNILSGHGELYTWYKDGKLIKAESTTNNFQVTEPGSYSFRFKQGVCDVYSAPLQVVAKSTMTTSINNSLNPNQDSVQICQGMLTTFFVNTDFLENTYPSTPVTWYKNGSLYNSNGSYYFSTTESATLQATFMRGTCPVTTQKFKVIVGNVVNLDTIRVSENIDKLGCMPDKLKLTATILGAAIVNNTLNPYFNFKSQSSAENVTPTVEIIKASKNTALRETFTATYIHGQCTGKSLPLTLTEKDYAVKLKIKKTVSNATCGKNAILLTLNSDGQGFPVQWYRDGKAIEGAVGTNFGTNISGKYWADLKSGPSSKGDYCQFNSDTVTLNFSNSETKPVITQDVSGCKQGIYTLNTPKQTGFSYQWKKDGVALNGQNQANLAVSLAGKYSVEVYDGKCTTESVEQNLGGQITALTPICQQKEAQLGYSLKAKTYEWEFTNGQKSIESTIKMTINSGGVLRLKATEDNGCSIFVAKNIGEITTFKPNITFITPQFVVENVAFALNTPLQGYDVKFYTPFQTQPVGNVGYFLVSNAKATTHSGDYRIEVSKNGCLYSQTNNIQVVKSQDLPIIKLKDLSDKTYCQGEEITLDFEVIGKMPPNPVYQVQFYSPDNSYTYSNYINYTQTPIKIVIPYYYLGNIQVRLIALNATYTAQSFSAYTNLASNFTSVRKLNGNNNYLNIQNIDPKNPSNSVCKGNKVTLRADSLNVKLAYQWQLNGKDIANATKRTISASDSGQYTIKNTIDGCSNTSSYYLLMVSKNITAPIISYPNGITQVCTGSFIPLSTTLQNPDYQIQWKKDNVNITNATKTDYKVTESGTYSIEITDPVGGCKATTQAPPFVVGSLQNTLNYEGDIEVCRQPNQYLYSNYQVSDLLKVYGFQFQWLKDGVPISKANNPYFTATDKGSYQLKVEQGNCGVVSKPVRIISSDKYKIAFTSPAPTLYPTISCNLSYVYFNFKPVVYNSNITASTYNFYADGKKITPVYYSFRGLSYYYTNIDGKLTIDGTVTNSAGNTCEIVSDTLISNLKSTTNSFQSTSLSSDLLQNQCKKDTITIQSGYFSPYYQWSYQWFKDGKLIANTVSPFVKVVEEGIYTLETQSLDGCKSTMPAITIKRDGGLNLTLLTNSTVLCNSSASFINYTDFFQEPTLLQWTKDGKDIVGASNKTLATTSGGVYALKAQYGKCSGISSPITVTEVPAIDLSLTPKDSIVICPTGTVDLKTINDKNVTYQWLKNDNTILNATNSVFNTGEQASYSVVGQRQSCIKKSNSVQVFVRNIAPTATLSGDKQLTYGDSTAIKVDFTSSPPWTFKFADDTNKVLTASTSPYLRYVKPLESKIYTVSSIKNLCGVGKSNGTAKITVLILGTEEAIDGVKINLFPMPASTTLQLEVETLEANTLQWQLTDIQGRTLRISEKESKQTRHEQKISVEELPAGIYLFKVIVGEKTVYRKIIKE